ncbi:hyaluronoglucosaminidase [Streptomyces sp. NPDC001941]|uniref:hyaluronoglucosaminidase n=1 Tax=Streptomyces sp. NPDC001941 TaxID=3154659 RepID=UPI00332186F8
MASTRRLFLGAFTAGAASVAVGQGSAAAAPRNAPTAAPAEEVTTFPGYVRAQGFRTYNGGTTELHVTSTAQTDKLHALTVHQAGTAGSGVAMNIVSDNPDDSAVYLTGHERARGTLKITHIGPEDGTDTMASALSIDLVTDNERPTGTAAQGIFVQASKGPTTGNLLTLRNHAADDLVVKADGRVGVGVPIGDRPQGRVQIAQRDNATIGLYIRANSATASALAEFRDSDGTARTRVLANGTLSAQNAQFGSSSTQSYAGGEGVVGLRNADKAPDEKTPPVNGGVLFSQGGALKWMGPSGHVTDIASA